MKRAVLLYVGLTICVEPSSTRAAEPGASPSTQRDEQQARPGTREVEPPGPRLPAADQARNLARKPAWDPVDVALILPRLALTFPRCALKLVFWPVQKTIELVDRHAAVERAVGTVADALPVKREADPLAAETEDQSSTGVAPQVELDSFSGLVVGLKAFDADLGGHAEYGSAEARVGGMYDVAAQLAFRAARFGGSRLWLESVARYESEPALLFNGLGDAREVSGGNDLAPRSAANATRYAQERSLSLVRAGYTGGEPGRLFQLGATTIYSVRRLSGSTREPSIETVYDGRELVGFGERVASLETDVNVTFNTLEPPLLAHSGVYLDAFAGRVPELNRYGYWHAGIDATIYVNLFHGDRLLVLRALVEGVAGNREEIPFADLPSLGGPHRLRGYPLDRFRAEKAALGSLDYHYPIHQHVAGALFVEAGRAEGSFGDYFDSQWNASYGAGFSIRSREKQLFSFHLAYGNDVQFFLTTDPWRVFSKRDSEL